MYKIILILLFLPASSFADQWFCSQGSSRKTEAAVYSCGVGISEKEDEARDMAFQSAAKEFNRICNISEDCHGRKVDVEAARQECEKQADGKYVCRRMLIYSFESSTSINNLDSTVFIEKYITKETVLKRFGVPTSISDNNNFKVSFYYHDRPFCQPQDCKVDFEFGRVQSYSGFKPEATDMVREPASVWKSVKRQLYLSDD